MEQTPREQQSQEQQAKCRTQILGTPKHEIYESILKHRRNRRLDEYDDDYNDDDPDCYCEWVNQKRKNDP